MWCAWVYKAAVLLTQFCEQLQLLSRLVGFSLNELVDSCLYSGLDGRIPVKPFEVSLDGKKVFELIGVHGGRDYT